MAGNNGPLIGPRQVTEFIKPYYRRIWDMLESRGARVFRQDSDGDMRPVFQAFIDAGLNMMYPVEPAAGMDLVELRETYGTQMAYMGGIDKHVIRRSKEEIVAELEYKIPPMVAQRRLHPGPGPSDSQRDAAGELPFLYRQSLGDSRQGGGQAVEKDRTRIERMRRICRINLGFYPRKSA